MIKMLIKVAFNTLESLNKYQNTNIPMTFTKFHLNNIPEQFNI